MDEIDEKCGPVIVENGDYVVRSTEEVLRPFFTDESLQAAMDAQQPADPQSSAPPPAAALPELRLVLLGRKGAGKSAAGNTILSGGIGGGGGGGGGFESGKPTEECVKRRADVEGKKVTVVDTPGWEWYYPLNSTPNWVRRETLRSVSLCPPGPHAVLLVVRSRASVTEDYVSEMEEHLEPLGRGVWEHTMLLFTRGDELGLVSMEQHILTSGPALQRLLQKCGNRYHVVDNRSKADGAQVKELMGKLEAMVAGKKGGGGHLEMDATVLTGLEADGKRRARERRKKQRQMEEQMQRGTIKAALMSDSPQGSELDAHQSFSKTPRRLPEVRLVLLGERETGKSSAANTILGQIGSFQAGVVTEECARRQAEVAMRQVTVVDTPGWEAGIAGTTPERVKREIAGSVALCPPGPHALLLTLRVDTLVKAGHVREHLELLGEGVWRHVMLLFTHGDQLREGVDIEQHIQGGGRDLRWLLEKCRGRYHVTGDVDGKGGRGGVTELLQKVEKMVTVNRCEAFSGLVQEIVDKSRVRNEKFNQRLKDMGDKMLRQEAELKNMRDREMKSIRWFFERKKKVKSPGKADVQREEEEDEDRRVGERKHDIGELEERMRWLTEDKEREIQDLSVEMERIRVALNQSEREQDRASLSLELKEREIEELTERSEEQQLKILDLERAAVDREHGRRQREESIRAEKQEWINKVRQIEETVELQRKEKAEWMDSIDALKAQMEKNKRHCDNIVERKEQDKNRAIAEMERKLMEKDKELEEARKEALEEKQMSHENLKQYEEQADQELEEMKAQHEQEIERNEHNKKTEIQGMKLQHQEEMARRICEIEKMIEAMKIQHREEIDQRLRDNAKDIQTLREQFAREAEEQMQAKKREIADLEQMYFVQIEGEMLEDEKEKEMIHLNHEKETELKMREKDEEIEVLRLQHREEMERRMNEMEEQIKFSRAEYKEERDRHVKEREEEVDRLQQEYSDRLKALEQERQREIKELKLQHSEEMENQLQDRRREIRELEQVYAAQMEEKEIEFKKEKELTNENHEMHISREVHERDRWMDELKCQYAEREREMKRVEVKLQQKEAEGVDHLNYKEDMERRLEERETQLKAMEERWTEFQRRVRQTEEDRERNHESRGRQMEKRLAEEKRTIDKLNEHIKDIEEILLRKDEERGEIVLNQRREAERQLQDREREMGEVEARLSSDMETKVKEKEGEIESLKQRADDMEESWREERNRTEGLVKAIEEKSEELTRARRLLAERDDELHGAKQTCAKYLKEVEELKEGSENQTTTMSEIQLRQSDRDREKDEELEQLRQRDRQNEKEIAQLKLRSEQTKAELKELTGRMEEEMSSMIRGYEEEIATRNESIEATARDGDRALRRSEEESRRRFSELSEKYEESLRRVDELREQIEKTRKEADNLRMKCEELKKEKDEEVANRLPGYEEKVRSMESEIQRIREERDLEVGSLKEAMDKLQGEVERTKWQERKAEKQMIEMREDLHRQLQEKQSEQRTKDDEAQEGVSERERDVGERELVLSRSEEELSKRQHEHHAKEEELGEKETRLGSREKELSQREANVEKQQQQQQEDKAKYEREAILREEIINRKERELENLLGALEGKQKELNFHGQDLQKKVKGLRDQGKELKDREYHLRNEEQDLLSWKSELQMRKEHVNCTTQQLDDMRRDLALLKEELCNKERKIKESFGKLSKWELNLKEREEGLQKAETRRDLKTGGDEADDDDNVRVHQGDLFDRNAESSEDDLHGEASEIREQERGRDSDRGDTARDREDQRGRTAPSAAESNNCHIQTQTQTEMGAGSEGVRGRRVEARKDGGKEALERTEVSGDYQFLSAGQGQRGSINNESVGSDLKVVLLGESWSSRSPSGVTLLCGESSKTDGSTSGPWRGQVAGRNLSIIEPPGLKWRDGPDSIDAAQRKSILQSISWCHPGPHVVLLLMPAFLSCTQKYRRAVEEHMSLFGEKDIWERTLVVFTWGEVLGESAEQHVLKNGELTGLVERCRGRYHVLTRKKSNSMIEGLFEKIDNIMDMNREKMLV